MLKEAEYLRRENINLRSSIKDRYRLGDIIGKSPLMQNVYETILDAAGTNANVIIYGESGTGKELVASAIHKLSSRSKNAFVPVNCAAIPENLLESEFFGHKKGAFTGAHIDKHGYLDMADHGVLFLDEVGELSPNLQAKLLRAIEGGEYSPVGSHITKTSDFRIIAATKSNILEQLSDGLMREDFFFRIHIIPIYLPPLRHRKDDIPLLVEHFLKLYHHDNRDLSIPGQVMEALFNYDWPGNVRELRNVIHRYLAVRQLDFLATSVLRPVAFDKSSESQANVTKENFALNRKVKDIEKATIIEALDKYKWNKSKTAVALGITRKTLLRKIKRFELS